MDFKNTKETGEKTLTEIYKELQQAKINSSKEFNKKPTHKTTIRISRRGLNISVVAIVVIFVIVLSISTRNIFASNVSVENQKIEIEENHEAIQIEEVINNNAKDIQRKTLTTENRAIDFETTYQDNPDLPKDEQKVIQPGEKGNKVVTVVKTYTATSNKEEISDENILNETITKVPVKQVIEVGTSELLGKFKIHLGDNLYTTTDVSMKKTADENSETVYVVGQYYEVKILAVEGNYVKVSYGIYTGYVDSNLLVSEYTNPEYVEKCRLQKAKNGVNFDMDVSKPSGLTLDDFKKILSNNPRDVNKIFENNAESFYNAELKYNVNGVLLAAIGIHESAWGTSAISKDKKNLFGYGAYDSDPYNSAFTFEDYSEGIEILAKALTKNYLNPSGTIIYGGETATGKYYNGKTIASINIRYATDENWGHAVYNIMEGLYEKLQ